MNWNTQKNTILTISAAFLFSAAFLANDPFGLFEGGYDKSQPLLAGRSSSIEEVSVNRPGGSFTLKRGPVGWNVVNHGDNMEYSANAGKVENGLRSLYEARRFQVVSSDEAKRDQFGVGDTGLSISLGEVVLHIGHPGPAANTTLVRLADEEKVYSVKGNLNSEWNQNIDYFRNKKLFHFEKENIRSVSIQSSNSYKLFQNAEGRWELTQRGQTSDAVEGRRSRLLDDISKLEGSSFYEGRPPKSPYMEIELELNTGTSEILDVRRVKDLYIVKSVNNPYWMEIPEYKITSLNPPLSELVAADEAAQ